MKDKVITVHDNDDWLGQDYGVVLAMRMAMWRFLFPLSSEDDGLKIKSESKKYE